MCIRDSVYARQPYVGELVFTAFSGSHQDAINKGMEYMRQTGSDYWEIPYLPIDPADVGRQYEPIIRINSQSGKGGAAFVMQNVFGYHLPKNMHPEFGALVKAECDRLGRELSADCLLYTSEKALYHCYAASEHYWAAAYGACGGQHPAGYSDPLAPHAGL